MAETATLTPPADATAPAGPTAGAEGPRRNRLRAAFGGSGAWWLLGPPLVFLVLLLLGPLVFLVIEAFTKVDPNAGSGTGVSRALDDHVFRASLWRTFVLALTVSVLTLIFGTIYALAIAVAPKGVAIFLVVSLFTLFWTSLLVRTYGWILLYLPQGPIYSVLHDLGLRKEPIEIYQTTAASYPAMVHVMLPYVVLPVFAATRQLDPMHLRAARVLGAKPLLILRKVVLPQLRAGIMAGAVLVFIMSLGFYVTPQLLGSPTGQMVAGLIGQSFNVPGETPVAAAMSLVLLAIVVLVYLVADRVFKVSEQWGQG
jgi:putative spermidine/putrescine transport system permease protein